VLGVDRPAGTILDDQLLNAIADGTFGLMKRPADAGRGLDGVAQSDAYYNPAGELLTSTSSTKGPVMAATAAVRPQDR
jgi:hypothetical protein